MRYGSHVIAVVAVFALLGGCSSAPPAHPVAPAAVAVVPAVQRAEAALASASGSLVSGRVVLLPAVQGVRITGTIGGLSPGVSYGFRMHERGDCSAVDASSAGGYFNPTSAPHGRAGAGADHPGELDNLVADGEGVVQLDRVLLGASLGGGSNNVLGKALVVHANPDGYRTQPAGNAGVRLACGVIKAAR